MPHKDILESFWDISKCERYGNGFIHDHENWRYQYLSGTNLFMSALERPHSQSLSRWHFQRPWNCKGIEVFASEDLLNYKNKDKAKKLQMS